MAKRNPLPKNDRPNDGDTINTSSMSLEDRAPVANDVAAETQNSVKRIAAAVKAIVNAENGKRAAYETAYWYFGHGGYLLDGFKQKGAAASAIIGPLLFPGRDTSTFTAEEHTSCRNKAAYWERLGSAFVGLPLKGSGKGSAGTDPKKPTAHAKLLKQSFASHAKDMSASEGFTFLMDTLTTFLPRLVVGDAFTVTETAQKMYADMLDAENKVRDAEAAAQAAAEAAAQAAAA